MATTGDLLNDGNGYIYLVAYDLVTNVSRLVCISAPIGSEYEIGSIYSDGEAYISDLRAKGKALFNLKDKNIQAHKPKDKIVNFTMTLYDDDSVKEKLKVMDRADCMMDDSRNEIPNEYNDMLNNMELGEQVKITVEVLEK